MGRAATLGRRQGDDPGTDSASEGETGSSPEGDRPADADRTRMPEFENKRAALPRDRGNPGDQHKKRLQDDLPGNRKTGKGPKWINFHIILRVSRSIRRSTN